MSAVEAGVRNGSFLVPFSFRRLDAFGGYQSGVPSPAWYELVWRLGSERAASVMLGSIVETLRTEKQSVSAADLIAAQTMAQGLASMRGHRTLLRSDLLDGLASALLKQAQDVPLPWTRRGDLQVGTDPISGETDTASILVADSSPISVKNSLNDAAFLPSVPHMIEPVS